MDWLDLDMAIINGTFTAQTLADYNAAMAPPVTMVQGMPVENASAPVLTPENAPPGVTFTVGNMPLTTPMPPIAAPEFSLPGDMPLSAPPLPVLTPANAPAGVTFLTGNMPLFGGDR